MYCFIVNKVSGNGKALKVWYQIEKKLQEKNVYYCVHFTQKPKHATLLVQELINKEKVTVIVVVGGDGTIHEVINGLVGTNTPLGIIPAGSGNDFSRGLGIPLKHDKALERILSGKPKIIDIGYVNSTYFGTVSGIGFDGEVAQTTNISIYKKLLNFVRMGQISYIISAINVLFRYKPMDISLMIDQKLYEIPKVWLIAVANLPFYGGGLAICPKAESNDGLFDICIVQGMSKWEFIRVFPLVFKGNHTSSPSIQIIKGKELEIYSSTPMLVHGDGEMIGQTPARIRIEPSALYVI
ncbi:YegS/Rv2252/BmrU family lipid kinase [Bacillus pakistanensis]|uniref:YegS/Rv2252/BmrU family lipid kinase n=1 Tax=Rossellomorea pakistanensis TaxID=992288 RepID=A0ABS2N9V9_9BACI|nr:diacylglycerol kinase family protein [Bacillus pakistanensis]MBM7584631.1 YegS/Rv2252/BmrU family lipid kinase [Bacillus pakistanensis]